ncbi:MAG: dihydroxyacetone kinase subunit DhaL [Propionibacteriaceae bacterium]
MLTTETIAAWLNDFATTIHANADLLTDLDRQIGDADHGFNMDRGCQAIAELAAADFSDAAGLLKKAGMTLVSTVGGASGPLYGTFFLRFSGAIGADGDLDPQCLGDAFAAALEGIISRGKAVEGDKTMVDALAPAVKAYQTAIESEKTIAEALSDAAQAAAAGRDATTAMIAHKGRASYLGERAQGVQDPGATSMTFLLESAARTLV